MKVLIDFSDIELRGEDNSLDLGGLDNPVSVEVSRLPGILVFLLSCVSFRRLPHHSFLVGNSNEWC